MAQDSWTCVLVKYMSEPEPYDTDAERAARARGRPPGQGRGFNLSRHLSALEEAGYILIEKVFEHKRPRTRLSLTPAGRTAFESHLDALRRIVDGRSDGVDERAT